MNFYDLSTVWVVRNETPHILHTARSEKDAIEFGNRSVSDRNFIVKVYTLKENAVSYEPITRERPIVKEERPASPPPINLDGLNSSSLNGILI